MAIYKVLSELGDQRSSTSTDKCSFNGALEDFVAMDGHAFAQYDQMFKDLVDLNKDMHICLGLPLDINRKVVANQIIRYKDAFKLPEHYLRVPLVLYWQQGNDERAILISDSDYIEAKGLYYCLTEPQNEFEGSRNEVLAMYLTPDDTMDIINAYNDMAAGKKSIGSIQRVYDRKYLDSVDEMKEKCIALSKQTFDDAIAKLKDMEVEERSEIIHKTVAKCFLIKKALYVQYMMAKDLLLNRHEGDTRKQRQFAKAYTDEVPIVSYSELWRVRSDDDVHAHEYEFHQRPKQEAAAPAPEQPESCQAPAAEPADEQPSCCAASAAENEEPVAQADEAVQEEK